MRHLGFTRLLIWLLLTLLGFRSFGVITLAWSNALSTLSLGLLRGRLGSFFLIFAFLSLLVFVAFCWLGTGRRNRHFTMHFQQKVVHSILLVILLITIAFASGLFSLTFISFLDIFQVLLSVIGIRFLPLILLLILFLRITEKFFIKLRLVLPRLSWLWIRQRFLCFWIFWRLFWARKLFVWAVLSLL